MKIKLSGMALLLGLVGWQGQAFGQTISYGIDKALNYDQLGTAEPNADPEQPASA